MANVMNVSEGYSLFVLIFFVQNSCSNCFRFQNVKPYITYVTFYFTNNDIFTKT
jgi:hypothetical protein